MFRDNAPMSAAQAATIILDGVRADTWRILVGDDAARHRRGGPRRPRARLRTGGSEPREHHRRRSRVTSSSAGGRVPGTRRHRQEGTMKQLTGLDASFLYMETGLAVRPRVEPVDLRASPRTIPTTTRSPPGGTRSNAASTCSSRCAAGCARCRSASTTRSGSTTPTSTSTSTSATPRCPPPGSDEQLAELVARIIGRPLDRSRPLWETYVIEGLPDDRFAHPHQGPPRHDRRRRPAPSC